MSAVLRVFVCSVTQPPQLKAGETDAQIRVPPIAANSEVSFLKAIVGVNDGQCACVWGVSVCLDFV